MRRGGKGETYVGIDIGKAQLDVHIYERAVDFSVLNDATGIRQLVGRLGRFPVCRLTAGPAVT